jgi:ATP-binding cassette subfamily B protein
VGIVPQDTVLFNDSLRYNIAYGRPGAGDDEVQAVARAAQLDGFIATLPEGYETSTRPETVGRQQRVAIADAAETRPS